MLVIERSEGKNPELLDNASLETLVATPSYMGYEFGDGKLQAVVIDSEEMEKFFNIHNIY